MNDCKSYKPKQDKKENLFFFACFVLVLVVGFGWWYAKEADRKALEVRRAEVEPCIEVIYYPDEPKFGVNRGQYIAEVKNTDECSFLNSY
jgi:hypothetical protein